MPDNFQTLQVGLTSPCSRQSVVSPSDSVDLPFVPRTLRVIVAGDLRLQDRFGTIVTYPGLVVGEHVDFRAVRVMLTGTTAVVAAWE